MPSFRVRRVDFSLGARVGEFVTWRARDGERRLRVAYFVPPSEHFAGIERVAHEIATGLAEGYRDVVEVHVIFATHYDEPLLEDAAYARHVLGVARLRHVAVELRRWARRHRCDVLVCPQVEASVVAWWATRGVRSVAVVPHLHGNPRVEESDGDWRTKIAFALFRRLVAPSSPGVLAVSRSLADYTAGTLCRSKPVLHAPNPVREFADDTSDRLRVGPFRFLCVARLSHQKGQDILLRAVVAARPQLPPFALTLVGAVPEESSLRALCRDLGLDDVVEFVGYCSDPDAYFRSADCFVLPSRWEGFGVVLVEALRFGLPLLAADCDFGPSDLVVDPAVGELVRPEDPAALAAGLVRVASAARSVEAENARRDLAKAYDRRAASRAHMAALRVLLGRGIGPGLEQVGPRRRAEQRWSRARAGQVGKP